MFSIRPALSKTNAGAELKNKASALQPGIGAIDQPLWHNCAVLPKFQFDAVADLVVKLAMTSGFEVCRSLGVHGKS